MNERLEQIKIANWLKSVLGEKYVVRYDDCESGFTRVIFKPLNIVTAEVLNTELKSEISANDFALKGEELYKAIALNLV